MAAKARCQCAPECKQPPLSQSPFCEHHRIRCPRISPLSGDEPRYRPEKYNKTRRIRDSHNCFAYAFDHLEIPPEEECNEKACPVPFHQPGRRSGYPKWSEVKGKRCPDLISRLRADIHGIETTTFTRKCPKGTSKIALVVDPSEDYHFYRQDSNGYWSHKPGAMPVTNLDATGRLIYDPALATRKYVSKSGDLDYTEFCSYMCAPRRKSLRFKRGGRARSRRMTQRRRASNL